MRILIIEDDSSIRNVLRMSLESECFVVDEAEDGEKGSYLARTNEYDAIILDNVMPKKFGTEVCREIRKIGIGTPIIMLSMKNDVSEKIEILKEGADDYMTKPFSFEELKARLQCIMRRPQGMVSDIIQFGNITLDRTKHIVKVRDKRVYLTKKEFALLEIMMMNNDNVVSRGQILEHAWDINANPFSNTIEAHMFGLRKKLQDKKKQIIQNIPGRGYKFSTEALQIA